MEMPSFVLQSSHYFFHGIELSRPQYRCPWSCTREWVTVSHQELHDKECRTPEKELRECHIDGISCGCEIDYSQLSSKGQILLFPPWGRKRHPQGSCYRHRNS